MQFSVFFLQNNTLLSFLAMAFDAEFLWPAAQSRRNGIWAQPLNAAWGSLPVFKLLE